MRSFKDLREKKLTPAEKKKREEIAKAMERDNPGMDMKKKMAIATWQAKKVAEEVELEEGIENMSHARLKWHMNTGVPHGSYSKDEMKAERDRRLSKVDTHAAYKKAKPSMNEEQIDEISLSHLSNTIAKSTGTKNVKTAMKPGEVKKGLDDLKKRLATLGQDPKMAKEAYEDEPASPDEKSMAMRQAKFIQYVGEEIMEHLEQDGDFPEWMQNKLSEFHQKAKDMHSTMSGSYEDDEEEMDEAVRKGAPKMQGDFLKKERERNRAHDAAMGRTPTGRKKPVRQMTSTQRSLASMRKEETQLDEISKKTLGSYIKKASANIASREADNARDYATGNRPVGINKKAVKNMKRTQYVNKAVDKLTQENVMSADKKPEKFVKPDGKVGIRMVRVDKKVVDKDA